MIKKLIEILSKPGSKHLTIKTIVGTSLISAQILLALGGNLATDDLKLRVETEIVCPVGDNQMQDKEIYQTNIEIDYSKLNFESMPYAGTHYLTLDEKDMLMLIRKAINEIDEEYINNGNRAVFSEGDSQYSYFDEYYILGMMTTETDLRLLELKDSEKLFDMKNYERFNGEHLGVKYNGLGMMNGETIKYIKDVDRKKVNDFEDHEYLTVENTKIKMTFDNLNPYDYIMSKKPKTEYEYKKYLAENIMFSTKCSYIYLNRIVKDYVKKGTHDNGYNALNSYSELSKYSNTEKQIFYALLGYNQGPRVTYELMMKNNLFSKNFEGEYVSNVDYPLETFEHAKSLRSEFGQELTN